MKTTPAEKGRLLGRTLYIPRMSVDGAAAFAAAYRAFGVEGRLLPESDARSLELARQYTIGEECHPEIVTLGGFLKVMESGGFEPAKTAFLMPTANGPCRFGQYKQLLEKTLGEKDLSEVLVVSPSSANGYGGVGDHAGELSRLAWWALVCSDALRKLLLQTRPYEINPGDTNKTHAECLGLLCGVVERRDLQMNEKFDALVAAMGEIKRRFAAVAADYSREKLFIGVLGEIYCRLDDFANSFLIRRLEKFGGEAWLASITEWVWYTNFMEKYELELQGRKFSKAMLGAVVKNRIQRKDEHKLLEPLKDRFEGYEEPRDTRDLVKPAEPYLPFWGSLGEMVLNAGGAVHLYENGVDGVVDISPFTCMNGIVSEAVYPKLSADHDGIPIRNFYFDGTESDHDRDVEIFLELAATYQRRKRKKRVLPSHFHV